MPASLSPGLSSVPPHTAQVLLLLLSKQYKLCRHLCHQPRPVLLLILLRCFEVGVPVGPPAEFVAVQAEALRLPHTLATTPRLGGGAGGGRII